MDELNVALDGVLRGSTALTSLLAQIPGGTAAAIYHLQAPEGAALPYVVFNTNSETEANDTAHRVKEDVISIRCFANSASCAGTIDAQVDTLLHNKRITVVGWSNLWCAREQRFEQKEDLSSGVPVYMEGGFYRITLEKS